MNPGLPCQKEGMRGKRGQRQRNKWARSSTHSTLMRTEKANREGRMAGDRHLCLIRAYPPRPLQADPGLTLRTTPSIHTQTPNRCLPSRPSRLGQRPVFQTGKAWQCWAPVPGEKGPHPAIDQHQREEAALGQVRAGHLLGVVETCSQPVRGCGSARSQRTNMHVTHPRACTSVSSSKGGMEGTRPEEWHHQEQVVHLLIFLQSCVS